MKKILLILALSLGVKVNAQIVGGFLPRNSSTSTATIGTIRTNSLVVTASTISVGAKTLTSGNTGTVAVLSDVPFALNFTAYNSTPADATTYYFGNATADWGSMTFQGSGKVFMPYNCTLVAWTANFSGTAGTAETATLSINIDNSATNLNTAITMSVNNVNTYSATGLSTTVNAGSYIEAKLITPTWVTNPSSIKVGIAFWFVRRS